MQTSATTTAAPQHDEDASYAALLEGIRVTSESPLFTTDATGLYETFLGALPPDRRQHYECRTCRHFVDRYGALVTIDDRGVHESPVWIRAIGVSAPFFADAIRAVVQVVHRARVTGVFLRSTPDWGVPTTMSPKSPTGTWHHMHVRPSAAMLHRASPILTSEQVMAEKVQDYGMLSRGLSEFSIDLVRKAHTLLTTGGLYRSEKCIGVAKWLLDLHESIAATKHKGRRENLVWRAVAAAPPGFCHVRTTMIATLLEDLEAGKEFAEIKRSFDAKMSPILYQRPQAAPTDGQLAAAETIVAKLDSAGSLARRFATLADVAPYAIWTPKVQKAEGDGGVFGHLKSTAQTSEPIDVPTQTMTWEKFARTVLSTAMRIELHVPHSNAPFFAFVTASDPNAPPILQWDSAEKRNPVSWYLYHNGSHASAFGLSVGSFVDVTAITMQPSRWNGESAHQGDGAYFVLQGARDATPTRAGLGLFPEILKSDYHGIRSAIEAYSRSRSLDGAEAASACGITIQKSMTHWGHTLRVTSGGARVNYRIDRFD